MGTTRRISKIICHKLRTSQIVLKKSLLAQISGKRHVR